MACDIGNQLCSGCQRAEPSMYCSCLSSRTYLCDRCFGPHRSKYPGLLHTAVPVEVVDFSRYQQRCKGFTQGREELQQNITRIDLCCAEVSSEVEALINRVRRFRDDFLRDMQNWKVKLSGQINESIAEVETTLVQEEVKLRGSYSAALRDYSPGCLVLFTFEIDSRQVEACLPNLVKTHLSQTKFPAPEVKSEGTEIFWITESNIQWFDISTLQWHTPVPLHSRIQANKGSRWAIVDATRVALCGGGLGEA